MKESALIRKLALAMAVSVGLAHIASGQDGPAPSVAAKEAEASQSAAATPLATQKEGAMPQSGLASPLLAELSAGKDDAKSSASQVAESSPVIVIGFMGGFVGHDNTAHSPVQIAAHLREAHPSGVYVKVFENRRREDAHREILNLLDTKHDGKITAEEKQKARIILYGMSWGGSETVSLANELNGEGIPVLLTVQVDSVAKVRQNDVVIPPNVSEAANFYQPDGLVHGKSRIRAADESRTKILGNFRFEYKSKNIRCENYPWYDKVFVKYHTEIECDPTVWRQVESLIVSKLPPALAR